MKRSDVPGRERSKLGGNFIEYGMLVLGALVLSYAFNAFLAPNQIASGGVTGVSILFERLLGWEPAFSQWCINIPLFILGYFLLGRRSSWKTAVGTVLLPFFIYVTRDVTPLTWNPLLASLFGGIGSGLGLGLIFRSKGTTGGLSLAARIVHKYSGMTLGVCLAMFDAIVIIGAGIVFTAEQALYALIGLYVTMKTIDVVQMGLSYSKVAFIISEEIEKMEHTILNELDRGMTKLRGYGGFTGRDKNVYMVVINHTEVSRLKGFVRAVDPSAFVIIANAHEVLGEGFSGYSET